MGVPGTLAPTLMNGLEEVIQDHRYPGERPSWSGVVADGMMPRTDSYPSWGAWFRPRGRAFADGYSQETASEGTVSLIWFIPAVAGGHTPADDLAATNWLHSSQELSRIGFKKHAVNLGVRTWRITTVVGPSQLRGRPWILTLRADYDVELI